MKLQLYQLGSIQKLIERMDNYTKGRIPKIKECVVVCESSDMRSDGFCTLFNDLLEERFKIKVMSF